MMTDYVFAAALALFFSTALLVYLVKKKLRLKLLSRTKVNEKEFLAVRIESDDFLFLKEDDGVTFIQSLDETDDFEEVSLHEQKQEVKEGSLKIPSHEKAS